MQTISISLAASGMVLAGEIRSSHEPNARVLCGKGVTLTESLINRLRQMGIESVSVEGHPVKMEGEQTVGDMLAALDERFSRVAHDPLMMRIKEIYKRQILRSMGEDANG
jgi:hypothetical protein